MASHRAGSVIIKIKFKTDYMAPAFFFLGLPEGHPDPPAAPTGSEQASGSSGWHQNVLGSKMPLSRKAAWYQLFLCSRFSEGNGQTGKTRGGETSSGCRCPLEKPFITVYPLRSISVTLPWLPIVNWSFSYLNLNNLFSSCCPIYHCLSELVAGLPFMMRPGKFRLS